MVMGVHFAMNNLARFFQGFDPMSFGKLDFTMSFWIRIDLVDGNTRCLISSAEYPSWRFVMVIY